MSGQPEFVRPAPTDVPALLEETLSKASGLADRKWALVGTPQALLADLDAQRVTQALLVLADNAAHHTAPGDRIVLGAGADAATLRLRVADTGTGVALADRGRIFARFARGNGSARRSDGAGLGLAIASAIAGAHGGHVEVSDGVGTGLPGQSGPGATFTLVLPLRAESEVR
ncbi:ATP-binding protein [Actinomycetospora lutea]|uniref:sensor histidine kinase n=1 Tax=Actinomycetospora lutea TaxID=663604 RepID=UPI002366228C|nr:ATP-binding protein [Actinomycetospora lutea]MDD7940706.1 ATP-binding protein [Actinomycetospora lutea]